MSSISNYKSSIEKLNPLEDSKFLYNPKRWSKLNLESKKVVKHFEGTEVSRKNVIQSFEDYFKGRSDYLFPFTMTMIWGFNDTGYGTYRTNKYVESKENRATIENAFEAIKKGEIKQAYSLLVEIKGLNVSYISKILYFSTRALKQENYCLIFDIRVARALVKLLDSEGGITDLLNITPSGKYADFENYNKLIHKWAKEIKVEAEQIEMFLFVGEF